MRNSIKAIYANLIKAKNIIFPITERVRSILKSAETGKTPTIAIAPESGEISTYLTNGKRYEITGWITDDLFVIMSDNGDYLRCYAPECAHLIHKPWKLI